MAKKDRESLINQLYQEVIGGEDGSRESRYVASTGTLFGDPERFKREKEEKQQKDEQGEDPWNKLDLKPTDVK